MFDIDKVQVVNMFLMGYSIGYIMSVIPCIVGEIINLVFRIAKGGHD